MCEWNKRGNRIWDGGDGCINDTSMREREYDVM